METNEQTTAQDAPAANTTTNTSAGSNTEIPDTVRLAHAAREGLAKENERLEKNLRELRELTARNVLGGSTYAGQPIPQDRELTNQEYIKEVQAGRIPQKR